MCLELLDHLEEIALLNATWHVQFSIVIFCRSFILRPCNIGLFGWGSRQASVRDGKWKEKKQRNYIVYRFIASIEVWFSMSRKKHTQPRTTKGHPSIRSCGGDGEDMFSDCRMLFLLGGMREIEKSQRNMKYEQRKNPQRESTNLFCMRFFFSKV